MGKETSPSLQTDGVKQNKSPSTPDCQLLAPLSITVIAVGRPEALARRRLALRHLQAGEFHRAGAWRVQTRYTHNL